MNKSILAIALASTIATAPAFAGDESIMFELGIGFGQSGGTSKTAEELANPFNNKFCYHRPSSRMVYGAIRYRYDRVETHVARWFNESDQERCDRNAWAVGLGYTLDTQDIDGNSVDDYYATYTPGIAYTWGDNKEFNVQDNTNTNWRLKDNFQMYNRVAVGGGTVDGLAEVAIVRYGNIISTDYERKGENFVTLTLGARDFDDGSGTATTVVNEFNIIVEDHTVVAPEQSAPVEGVAPTEEAVDANPDLF